MEWNSSVQTADQSKFNFNPSWQHFCSLVADPYFKNDAIPFGTLQRISLQYRLFCDFALILRNCGHNLMKLRLRFSHRGVIVIVIVSMFLVCTQTIEVITEQFTPLAQGWQSIILVLPINPKSSLEDSHYNCNS